MQDNGEGAAPERQPGKSQRNLQEAIEDAARKAGHDAVGKSFRVHIEVDVGNPRVSEYRVTLEG